MRKKYGRLLALWSLAALLMTGLLSGCGSGMQNDRQNGSMAPSAAVSETDGREQTAGGDTDGTAVQAADGEIDETARTTADETDRPLRTADRETAAETEPNEERGKAETEPAGDEAVLPEEGSYTSKEDVALYLYTYGHLPDNFITKNEAKNWDGIMQKETWRKWRREKASAATGSAIMKGCCRKKTAESGRNVTSVMRRAIGTANGSCFPMTA